MDVSVREIVRKKIKASLIFFCFVLLLNCINDTTNIDVTLMYEQQKAVKLCFANTDKISNVTIYRNDHPETPILGDFINSGDTSCFKPVIPFTAGREYAIYHDDKLVKKIAVRSFEKDPVALEAIYPTTDKVPENLLKIYLVFSQPMAEVGNALDHIKVKNITTNKEVKVFLDLQTELWNKAHTQLTLWLDPGRIKTGLIPNQQKGLPILKGNDYEIYIDKNWKAANGMSLDKSYIKRLVVGDRDIEKPDYNSWNLVLPKNNTMKPLIIELNEALDAILLRESFTILNNSGAVVMGNYHINEDENKLVFTPSSNWTSGIYTIEITSKLEDLAGNNLNRLFDEAVSSKNEADESFETVKKRTFAL